MKLNRNFAKLKPDGTLEFCPIPLTVVTHHHEEWDEPVLDPETGEPTGETEHKTRDWVAHRDAVMTYALEIMNEVKAGTRPAPTMDEFKAGLPQIVWSYTE